MPTSDVTIRSAVLNDLPILLDFEQAIINYERPFDPTLKDKKINYYDLKGMILTKAVEVLVAIHNNKIIEFIKKKNKETKYVVSNCAGAQLIGESGIADGRKIVTWIGGGEQLQKDYPNLKVQDDNKVTFVEDGKFSSSNGNLASYISALNLLEKMTSPEHREFVESYLYLDRLQNWRK